MLCGNGCSSIYTAHPPTDARARAHSLSRSLTHTHAVAGTAAATSSPQITCQRREITLGLEPRRLGFLLLPSSGARGTDCLAFAGPRRRLSLPRALPEEMVIRDRGSSSAAVGETLGGGGGGGIGITPEEREAARRGGETRTPTPTKTNPARLRPPRLVNRSFAKET